MTNILDRLFTVVSSENNKFYICNLADDSYSNAFNSEDECYSYINTFGKELLNMNIWQDIINTDL